MGKRVYLVTHTDLDGIGCEILIKTIYPDCVVYNEDHQTVDKRIMEIISHPEKIERLFITDIAPTNTNIIQELDQIGKLFPITLVDHHKTAEERFAEYGAKCSWALINQDMCGTLGFYHYLYNSLEGKQLNKLAKYEMFSIYVDDYDRWIRKYPESEKINSLLHIYGHAEFVERCLLTSDPTLLTEIEHTIVEMDDKKKQDYVSSILETGSYLKIGNQKAFVCFAEKNASQIGEEARQVGLEADFIAIINVKYASVCLRSIVPNCDVSEIAKKYGGGGHRAAAGFEFDNSLIEKLVEKIFRS